MTTTFASRLATRNSSVPVLQTVKRTIGLAELCGARPHPDLPQDKPIALSIRDPAHLLTALAACDGRVPALLLLLYDLAPDIVETLAAAAGCRTVISDRSDVAGAVTPETAFTSDLATPADGAFETSWIMTTSGTSGLPKLIRHRLEGLSRTVRPWRGAQAPPVWGLTYEATRFAGMQVLLQATLGGGLLVACDPEMPVSDKLRHLVKFGATHLSATPTFWRQVMMHPLSRQLKPEQITLGGEIADQSVLDGLADRFPAARMSHIYASTETGVGFSVKDRREGFPASYLQDEVNGVRLKIVGGRLWIRSAGPKAEAIGSAGAIVCGEDGYVDTMDRVEQRGDRVFFLGRDASMVNVGGYKVHPEAVERVISQLAEVALVRVTSRRNPIAGAVLVAQVIPAQAVEDPEAFKARVIRHCRATLPRQAVPALVQLEELLPINAAGKLPRKD